MEPIVAEEWRPVVGFNIELSEYYHVSNLGRLKSLNRTTVGKNGKFYNYKEKIIKGSVGEDGYIKVKLTGKEKHIYREMQVVVAYAFLEQCPGVHGNKSCDYQIDHIDNNKTNNCASNLRWVTCRHNIQKSHTLREKYVKGEEVGSSSLSSNDIINIRQDFRDYQIIADEYGVSKSAITNIILGKSWKHIEYPEYLKEKQIKNRKGKRLKIEPKEIENILLDDRSPSQIANEYKVSQSLVYSIKNKQKRAKDIPDDIVPVKMDRSKGELSPKAKLSKDDVIKIKNDSRKYKYISEEYNININTVWRIKNNLTWKHLS